MAAALPLQLQVAMAAGTADTVTYGSLFGFTDLNPLGKLVHTFQYLIFDPLTFIDSDTREAVPHLAASWERVDDLTVDFKLRDDVTFSNGDKLTAADVKFSFDTVTTEKLSHARLLNTISSAEVIDDLTVRFVTAAPDPLIAKRLAMLFIVPKSVYEAAGTQSFGSNPVGTGQYVMTALTPNTSFTLTARDDSWQGVGATKEVVFNIYTDGNAFLAATESGQIDVAQQLPTQAVAGFPGYQMDQIAVGSPFLLQLNATQAPFDDVRVRKAVNHAINIDALIRVIQSGVGARLNGQLPQTDCVGHNPDVKDYEYDVEKAKTLLKEAGLEAGFDTEIVGQQRDRALLEAIAGELAKVGIRAVVNALDYSVWVEGFNKGTIWPIFAKGLDYGPIYDVDQSYQWVTAGDEGRKGYVDPKWDEMLKASRGELDPAKRLAMLQEMAVYLHDQAPFVFLYSQQWLIASRDGIKGLDLGTGKWMDAGKVSLAV